MLRKQRPVSTQLNKTTNTCTHTHIHTMENYNINVNFKNSYEVEPYALSFTNRKQRSYLAQYCCGILLLSIETGR